MIASASNDSLVCPVLKGRYLCGKTCIESNHPVGCKEIPPVFGIYTELSENEERAELIVQIEQETTSSKRTVYKFGPGFNKLVLEPNREQVWSKNTKVQSTCIDSSTLVIQMSALDQIQISTGRSVPSYFLSTQSMFKSPDGSLIIKAQKAIQHSSEPRLDIKNTDLKCRPL